MAAKRRPRVLAIGSDEALEVVQEALGDLVTIVQCVDIRRLRRDYGAAVASEVILQLAIDGLPAQERAANRRNR
jgi:hypothetical protein